MPENFKIIPFQQNEHSGLVEQVLKIEKEVDGEYEHLFPPEAVEPMFDPAEYENKGGIFALGLLEYKLIAIGGYLPISKDTVELNHLRVVKNYQGKGYGGELLEYLEQSAQNDGFKKIVLDTLEDREKTLRFYQNRGYKKTGRKKYGKTAVILFEKNINL
jgi:GNAT superfamily N-acetyltransferase